jgi:hypothetical protein
MSNLTIEKIKATIAFEEDTMTYATLCYFLAEWKTKGDSIEEVFEKYKDKIYSMQLIINALGTQARVSWAKTVGYINELEESLIKEDESPNNKKRNS